LVAGVFAILAGGLAIAYGLLLELSFGNTLVMVGAFGVCSGIIVLAQSVVVHELRNIARRLGPGAAAEPHLRPALAPAGPSGSAAGEGPDAGFFPGASSEPQSMRAAASPPWREDNAAREAMRQEPPPYAPEQAEQAPPPRRRNLLISSSMRKDRERAVQQPGEDAPPDRAGPPPLGETPANFDETWPRVERARPMEPFPQRRAPRKPSALNEGGVANVVPAERPAQHSAEPTVIKSGVVDGMAYSLYSDGSIQAQMPEGMMRFASIDELRAHLDQRS
jgi:hypothetical protein